MRFSLRLRMPREPASAETAAIARMFIFAWLFAALKGWVMGSRPKDNDSLVMYDRMLLWLTFGLAAIGFIMVTSASMPVGQRLANDPFLFAKRDGLYIVLAFALAMITYVCRWISGSATYRDADRLDRHAADRTGSRQLGKRRIALDSPWSAAYSAGGVPSCRCSATSPTIWCVKPTKCVTTCGFLKPMGVIFVLAILLQNAADLGTVVVLFVTTLAMFLAGAKLWQFIAIIGMGISAVVLLILAEPYRIRRVTPSGTGEDPFGSGYQLTVADGFRPRRVGAGPRQLGAKTGYYRKRTLTLSSPLSAKNSIISVWYWRF